VLYAGSCHATACCRPAMRRGLPRRCNPLASGPFTSCLAALMTGVGGSRLARSSFSISLSTVQCLLTRARPWT
jgi:hypothetical protein